jgi:AcrR family transcriptional regulator
MMENNDHTKKTTIKTAAKKLFFQFGLSKTSMDDIARQSHMAKPTLYYYYPSKESIFNEIVIDEAHTFINHVESKIPHDLSPDQKMIFFFKTFYEDLKQYIKELKKLPETLYESYPHGRPIIEKINDFFREKLKPLLQEGKEEGIFYYSEEEITVTAIVVMTDFLNLDWMRRFPEDVRDKTVDKVIEIILNGIRRNRQYES